MIAHLLTHALFRTRGGEFFKGTLMLLFVLMLPIGSVAGFSVYTWKHFAKESEYRRRFGEEWKTQYEATQGSLSVARNRVALALAAAVANTVVGIWLYCQLIPAMRGAEYATRRRRRRSSSRNRL